jgi:hypothetical protein
MEGVCLGKMVVITDGREEVVVMLMFVFTPFV